MLAAPRQVGCVVRQSESRANRQAPRRFRKVEEGVRNVNPPFQYHRWKCELNRGDFVNERRPIT